MMRAFGFSSRSWRTSFSLVMPLSRLSGTVQMSTSAEATPVWTSVSRWLMSP